MLYHRVDERGSRRYVHLTFGSPWPVVEVFMCLSKGTTHSPNALPVQLHLILVNLTTIQAQDFRDTHGDMLHGRRTLPIMYPMASRVLTVILIFGWSLHFAFLYRDAYPPAVAGVIVLGLCAGLRFLSMKSRDDDRTSYTVYNVSAQFSFITPRAHVIRSSSRVHRRFGCGLCTLRLLSRLSRWLLSRPTISFLGYYGL